MLNPPEISELKKQAIDWLLRLRSDDMNDDELVAFSDWLAQDHAHSVAFSEAEALFDQMTLAAKPEVEVQSSTSRDIESQQFIQLPIHANKDSVRRRPIKFSRWMTSTLAVAAIWLFVVNLFLPQQIHFIDNWSSDYYTQTGELREIKLSDGSRILLNTNSAISVNYTDSNRIITLHHGQVRFSVAKDLSRPFVVETESLKITALGTIFQVYKDENEAVNITVQEHSVAVSQQINKGSNASVTVETGQQLKYQSETVLLPAKNVELKQATAWQQHRVIINDQPLADLIAELQRYRNGRIFLLDDELKNLRITGVFSLDDPDAVMKSVCKVLSLKQTRLAKWWSIVHR